MEFEEIAKRLNLSKKEVIKIYSQAMRKLSTPTPENRKFWDYVNTHLKGDNKDGIITTE